MADVRCDRAGRFCFWGKRKSNAPLVETRGRDAEFAEERRKRKDLTQSARSLDTEVTEKKELAGVIYSRLFK